MAKTLVATSQEGFSLNTGNHTLISANCFSRERRTIELQPMLDYYVPCTLQAIETSAIKIVKVKVEVSSLVSSAKRYSPDFIQYPLVTRPVNSISHASQLPEEHSARLPFPAHRTIQAHKTLLSYQVSTFSWVEPVHVWAKCPA